MFFLFLHVNICCGYSLEVPQSLKHMFWVLIRSVLSVWNGTWFPCDCHVTGSHVTVIFPIKWPHTIGKICEKNAIKIKGVMASQVGVFRLICLIYGLFHSQRVKSWFQIRAVMIQSPHDKICIRIRASRCNTYHDTIFMHKSQLKSLNILGRHTCSKPSQRFILNNTYLRCPCLSHKWSVYFSNILDLCNLL